MILAFRWGYIKFFRKPKESIKNQEDQAPKTKLPGGADTKKRSRQRRRRGRRKTARRSNPKYSQVMTPCWSHSIKEYRKLSQPECVFLSGLGQCRFLLPTF